MKNITFWKDENWKLIHISQVISWKKCWVYCLILWKPLIARKWSKNSHHFAHYEWFNYQYYKETLVHLLAKKTLKETKKISLPYLIWTNYMMRNSIDKIEQNEIDNFLEWNKELKIIDKIEFADYLVLENIEVEKRIPINNDYIIADIYWEIIVESEIIPIIIEIMVSHPCDENKINKFKGTNYCVIEVDCNLMDEDLQNDENYIKNVLIEIFQGKYGKTFLNLPIKYKNLVKKYLDEIEKINKNFKNKEIKIVNNSELNWRLLKDFRVNVPKDCPVRLEIYNFFKNEYKFFSKVIENFELIKEILNNKIYWDFNLYNDKIWKYIIIDNEDIIAIKRPVFYDMDYSLRKEQDEKVKVYDEYQKSLNKIYFNSIENWDIKLKFFQTLNEYFLRITRLNIKIKDCCKNINHYDEYYKKIIKNYNVCSKISCKTCSKNKINEKWEYFCLY